MTSSESFVHLHLHTQYSLLDGTTRIEPLIAQASRFGMPAVAMTDHGNLFGAIEFYRTAKKAGIKPIIGCEMYLAPKNRRDREAQGVGEDDYSVGGGATTPYFHLILLAANETGYRNLMRMVSIANMEGFYYKPRIDKELLNRHSAGLIGLSGCLRGEIPYLLSRGLEAAADAAARQYQDIFGPENFFIEIQDNGLELQQTVNRQLVALARRIGIPLTATNDCHYLHKEDAHAHDVMLCLQTGKTVNMPNRMRFDTQQLYFKSPDEMTRGLGEIPESITNTVRIAERVNLEIKLGAVHLPRYDAPDGLTREDYLAQLAKDGLTKRLRARASAPPADYAARLDVELRVINAMGYAGYFLIVWDIIRYARSMSIPVGPGRGSAAGSLVSYALEITDIDPLAHGLLFERFLNPERISLPDIDMDFCMDRREEVIRYVTQKYGVDHVAQIITFGTMAAKAAIRDVGRVMEMPYADADRLAKLIPNVLNISLDDALAQEPKMQQAAESDTKVAEVVALARQLEGLTRHASTHAAGVVISAEPLTDHVPLYRGSHGEFVTQYAMEDLERVGLIKFDFLGLRTLTVIDHACRWINKDNPENPLDPAAIPLVDAATFALLGTGETSGLFQLESRGMRDLLMKMQPETFEDIVALIALYRPGPIGSGMIDDFVKRKRGQTKIQYLLPQLAPILATTYGVIVYQEQVMQIASALAGFSLGEADLLRRAMGKKKAEEMAAQKTRFVERAEAGGIVRAKAEQVFDLMEYFAGYGFNKSHSAAYALITYQTAWLKCHHPKAFLAALMTCEQGNSDRVMQHLGDCRRMGIRILPPDVNESDKDFTVVADGIRFGLAAIKNVGGAAVDVILAARVAGGRFGSLYDFCCRIDARKCNRRVIESLIHCGAFDSTGATGTRRAAMSEGLDAVLAAGAQAQAAENSGQLSMFENDAKVDPPLPDVPEWDDAERAKLEKALVGFYITAHPLTPYTEMLAQWSVTPIATLGEASGDKPVRLCGMIVSQKVATTRRGDKMSYLHLEDLTGSVEVIIFPDLYATAADLLTAETPIMILGTLDDGEKGLKIKATEVMPPGRPKPASSAPRALRRTQDDPREPVVPAAQVTPVTLIVSANTPPSELSALKTLLAGHPGNAPVILRIQATDGSSPDTTLKTPLRLALSTRLQEELAQRFGDGVRIAPIV